MMRVPAEAEGVVIDGGISGRTKFCTAEWELSYSWPFNTTNTISTRSITITIKYATETTALATQN
jgi:hypothetical protein